MTSPDGLMLASRKRGRKSGCRSLTGRGHFLDRGAICAPQCAKTAIAGLRDIQALVGSKTGPIRAIHNG
jgi:hypothetical protein